MHGIIFHEFRHFINQQKGFQEWNTILKNANLGGKLYLPTQMYPDVELESLFSAAGEQMKLDRNLLLEKFGRYIIPQFLRIFGQIIKAEWKLMDVLEHTENVIHRTIRQYDPNATPPELVCERISPSRVNIYYSSPRNMLAFGKGLVLGLSDHYKETVLIKENLMERNNKSVKVLEVSKG